MPNSTRPAPPGPTYRLQLTPEFTLADAADTAEYLRRLGAGAIYTSPVLAAEPGSTHGYDVVDPTRVSPDLGGEDSWLRLRERLDHLGLGLVVDIVPNHMSVRYPDTNPWWADVLRYGPDSRYARYFDIDWSQGPLLVPVLADDGDGGAAALRELTLTEGWLAYHEHRFPLAPGTLAPGADPQSVHERQHYRLVSWRRGDAELNYRRFFDIFEYAAVRVEEPEVFAAAHAEILRWVRAGEVQGLRVDHPDGLEDPGGYTRRLRAEAGCWLVVEKILARGESLPASWPVDGTTGYDVLREVCGVFVDPAGEGPMTELARRLGLPTDYAEVEADSRREVTKTALVAEVRRIAGLVQPLVSETERSGEAEGGGAPSGAAPEGVPEPVGAEQVHEAVTELLVAFPAYRSYLPEGEGTWGAAVELARQRTPHLAGALSLIDRTVRADPAGELARRIQQTSAMVVAKGTEDTAFYRYTRFVALNEVGGAPDAFGVAPTEFHTGALAREASWPATMTALSTHDTKRSEDVRARLAVLSEIPDEFGTAVRRWSARVALGEPALNLLAWQTLLGAWPICAGRLRRYLEKAAREAKLRTSWVDTDEEFEAEVRAWPDRVLGDAELRAEVATFVARIREAGWSNALGQKLVQLTAPGIPDIYQGTEVWDHSLVDPDNRRPVDFAARRRLLERLEQGWLPEVDETGAAKLHVVRTALRLRAERDLSGYRPLPATGAASTHVLAFARGAAADVVTVATRLPVGLASAGGWQDTTLPLPGEAGQWSDRLTGRVVYRHETPADLPMVRLADLLDRYPVALLVRDRAAPPSREAMETRAAEEIRSFYRGRSAPLPEGTAPPSESELEAADETRW